MKDIRRYTEKNNHLVTYKINHVVKIAGVTMPQLRMWERRYKILTPIRKNKVRYYTEDHLKKLINVVAINKTGIRIQVIAKMTDQEIKEKAFSALQSDNSKNNDVSHLLEPLLDLNDQLYNKISNLLKGKYFKHYVKKIILPCLKQLQTLWQIDAINKVQYLFGVNLLKNEMIVATHVKSQIIEERKSYKMICLTPFGSSDDVSLLYYTFLAQNYGFKTIFLGGPASISQLTDLHQKINNPAFLIVIDENQTGHDIKRCMNDLNDYFKKNPVFIAGNVVKKYQHLIPENFYTVSSDEEMKEIAENF